MTDTIRCGLALLVLFLLLGWVGDAHLWWRSYFSGRMEVQLNDCEDIQYAVDHSIPYMVLLLPREPCVISEPIFIGNGIGQLTLTGGWFTATAALGERPVFEIVQKKEETP